MNIRFLFCYLSLLAFAGGWSSNPFLVPKAWAQDRLWSKLPLQSSITQVQPWTGLVTWDDSEFRDLAAFKLEFFYLPYSAVSPAANRFDWAAFDRRLNAIAARGHHAIVRFYDTYPGKATGVPRWLKQTPGYRETRGTSEGLTTWFPDWSHLGYQQFIKEFYREFASRYDKDPRMAYLQVGFGLWSEYHIYDGPFQLGKTFPDKVYQAEFLTHLNTNFQQLPWMISIDAGDRDLSPITGNQSLLDLNFGLFDDSFLAEEHPRVNALNWRALQLSRFRRHPAGGEISYYTDRDQRLALSPSGPHGVPFEDMARQYRISFMIANDQPQYQTQERLKSASQALGYRFHVTSFERQGNQYRMTLRNSGIAPLYHDAWVHVEGVASTRSLKGLGPGQTLTLQWTLPHVQPNRVPTVAIRSDRLLPNQTLEFSANLR